MPPQRFPGAGIYLIYYTGDFSAYAKISAANQKGKCAQPIYVGKVILAGGRKSLEGFDVPYGHVPCNRISQHADSISAAKTLSLADFRCRWLVEDEVFIPLGENLLIRHFKPLWDVVVDGFGNHDPGADRVSGRKPTWDVLQGRLRGAPRPGAVPHLLFEPVGRLLPPRMDVGSGVTLLARGGSDPRITTL
jgi:hypothetical protein